MHSEPRGHYTNTGEQDLLCLTSRVVRRCILRGHNEYRRTGALLSRPWSSEMIYRRVLTSYEYTSARALLLRFWSRENRVFRGPSSTGEPELFHLDSEVVRRV